MKAGTLRHTVIVERRDATVDAYGEESSIWVQVCKRSAAMQTIGGSESFTANVQERAAIKHLIRIRYDRTTRTITPAMRATIDGRVFNIEQAFNWNERDREIHLVCEEVVIQ